MKRIIKETITNLVYTLIIRRLRDIDRGWYNVKECGLSTYYDCPRGTLWKSKRFISVT